ncbi:MAG: helix-turn-helix transcriptional regulator [Candidatus Paceibacterota bacterium]|jgi:transcriptional regulator with XRE-family HTH domain
MSKENSIIGDNIKRLRLQKDLSQDKLARLADIAFPTLTKIESGETPNPTIETVKKIAAALGVSIDELMK